LTYSKTVGGIFLSSGSVFGSIFVPQLFIKYANTE